MSAAQMHGLNREKGAAAAAAAAVGITGSLFRPRSQQSSWEYDKLKVGRLKAKLLDQQTNILVFGAALSLAPIRKKRGEREIS